jgi:hypothetical protein
LGFTNTHKSCDSFSLNTIEREIQSNREGERDSEENRDESDVDSDGEIDSESECEQSEDETFRNVGKFVLQVLGNILDDV